MYNLNNYTTVHVFLYYVFLIPTNVDFKSMHIVLYCLFIYNKFNKNYICREQTVLIINNANKSQ